jgi:arylformamidase
MQSRKSSKIKTLTIVTQSSRNAGMPNEDRMNAWGQRSIVGDSQLRWRQMTDDEREREYSPSSAIGGNYEPFLAAYKERSDAARRSFANIIECRYGPKPANTIDLVMPQNLSTDQQCPLIVFIHGGYWQELSKWESMFAAPEFLAEGMAFAAVDYTLAPTASIPEIIEECRSAVRWLRDAADDFAYSPDLILVTGSSAGAHLAAMTALPDPRSGEILPAGLVLVSGIFELEPVIGTSINTHLKMNVPVAHACSPLCMDVDDFPPTLLAWGEIEPDDFKTQSRAFATKLKENDVPVRALEIPSKNHFDVILDLADTGTALGTEVARLIRVVQPDMDGVTA